MPFETSPFGSADGSNVDGTVHNHFGQRELGNVAGSIKTEGREVELTLDINEEVITNGGPLLVDLVIPAGAVVTGAYARIDSAFTLGGTTPTINIGTDTSEGTNGIEISEAQGEAVGSYNIFASAQGTWAAPLAAATTVGVALGGTNPTSTGTGSGTVYIKYFLTRSA